MAGGVDAVCRAKEGVEDDEKEGGHALGKLKPSKNDVAPRIASRKMCSRLRPRRRAAGAQGIRMFTVTQLFVSGPDRSCLGAEADRGRRHTATRWRSSAWPSST